MGEPTFWDDTEKAQKINQELNDVKISVDKYKALCKKFDDMQVLWEMAMEEEDDSLDSKVEAMIEARQAARKAKNFAEADRIRDELKAMGYAVEDTAKGQKVRKQA